MPGMTRCRTPFHRFVTCANIPGPHRRESAVPKGDTEIIHMADSEMQQSGAFSVGVFGDRRSRGGRFDGGNEVRQSHDEAGGTFREWFETHVAPFSWVSRHA